MQAVSPTSNTPSAASIWRTPTPWLVGFSGGKDSTMLASLIIEVVAGIPDDQRKKPVAILCTDTRVEIPAIVEMVEGTLDIPWYHRPPSGLQF